MAELKINIGVVIEVENEYSTYINDTSHANDKPSDGLRVRAKIPLDKTNNKKDIPWAFPLMPKSFQSVPKIGESVLIFTEDAKESQRYYVGPIISQPQFNTFSPKNASTSLLVYHDTMPLEMVSNNPDTKGAYPKPNDVAMIGRGLEDIILRSNGGDGSTTNVVKESEVLLRAGVRGEPINDPNPNMVGNIIFNGVDPAYIQLKYMKGLSKKPNQEANSVINMVANRINIMSNKDSEISHNLGDNDDMIQSNKMDEIMDSLHQVPKGDKLVELLDIIKGCIMHHVHPWAGMEQCGDWSGYIRQLEKYDIQSILSEYVRIS